MIRTVTQWSIEEIYKKRDSIVFPDYQREPKLWNLKDKQLLIDSIFNNIDIPKLYFHETTKNTYEVVDGQQRLWAIWEFLDNDYKFKADKKTEELRPIDGKYYSDMSLKYQRTIRDYQLQITVIRDAADEYLRTLFLRLQLGLLLVAGEKLHASTGQIRDFVFNNMARNSFIKTVNIPGRRYAKETLCAQICINSFSRGNIHEFSRTRYDDLISFFEDYKKPEGRELKSFNDRTKHISAVLNTLNKYYNGKAHEIRSRSFVLSFYLIVEEFIETNQSINNIMPKFVSFSLALLKRLRAESLLGFKRKNEELYILQTYLSNAPGEKYQIARRHEKIKDLFGYYLSNGTIKGE